MATSYSLYPRYYTCADAWREPTETAWTGVVYRYDRTAPRDERVTVLFRSEQHATAAQAIACAVAWAADQGIDVQVD